jgi:hypothetical protein
MLFNPSFGLALSALLFVSTHARPQGSPLIPVAKADVELLHTRTGISADPRQDCKKAMQFGSCIGHNLLFSATELATLRQTIDFRCQSVTNVVDPFFDLEIDAISNCKGTKERLLSCAKAAKYSKDERSTMDEHWTCPNQDKHSASLFLQHRGDNASLHEDCAAVRSLLVIFKHFSSWQAVYLKGWIRDWCDLELVLDDTDLPTDDSAIPSIVSFDDICDISTTLLDAGYLLGFKHGVFKDLQSWVWDRCNKADAYIHVQSRAIHTDETDEIISQFAEAIAQTAQGQGEEAACAQAIFRASELANDYSSTLTSEQSTRVEDLVQLYCGDKSSQDMTCDDKPCESISNEDESSNDEIHGHESSDDESSDNESSDDESSNDEGSDGKSSDAKSCHCETTQPIDCGCLIDRPIPFRAIRIRDVEDVIHVSEDEDSCDWVRLVASVIAADDDLTADDTTKLEALVQHYCNDESSDEKTTSTGYSRGSTSIKRSIPTPTDTSALACTSSLECHRAPTAVRSSTTVGTTAVGPVDPIETTVIGLLDYRGVQTESPNDLIEVTGQDLERIAEEQEVEVACSAAIFIFVLSQAYNPTAEQNAAMKCFVQLYCDSSNGPHQPLDSDTKATLSARLFSAQTQPTATTDIPSKATSSMFEA